MERKSNPRDIAYQLQKLFLLLQTSEKMSLETVDLTASFGWENEGESAGGLITMFSV